MNAAQILNHRAVVGARREHGTELSLEFAPGADERDLSTGVDASGAAAAVTSGIKAVRPAGRAVLAGLGSSEVTLPIEHIQNLEITVTGIFRYADTWPTAIHLIASGLVELDALESDVNPRQPQGGCLPLTSPPHERF